MTSQQTTRLLDPVLLAQIDRLEFRAKHVVEGYLTGMHKSPYHGFSVEFAAHREYVPGDDIRHIDWRVWARADRYYIKQYEEETNLRCMLLLDCSKSMGYRSQDDGKDLGKFDLAATLAASLAWFMQKQHDAAGLVMFDDAVRASLPPSSHHVGLQRILEQIESTPLARQTDASSCFRELAAQIPTRCVVVLVSDLFMPAADLLAGIRDFRQRKCEVVVMHTLHADEVDFPFTQQTLFRGLEGAAQVLGDGRALRRPYLREMERFLARTREVCSSCGADYVPVHGTRGLVSGLTGYLVARSRRATGGTRR
jgi:uncharacterized protein (DUF58 family)